MLRNKARVCSLPLVPGLSLLLLLAVCIKPQPAAAGPLLSLPLFGLAAKGVSVGTKEGRPSLSKEIRLGLRFEDQTGKQIFDGELIANIVLPLTPGSHFMLRLPKAEINTPWFSCILEGKASGRLEKSSVAIDRLALHLSQVKLISAHGALSIPEAAISAAARVHLGQGRMELRELSIELEQRQIAKGSCTVSHESGLSLELGAPLHPMLSLLRELMPDLPLPPASNSTQDSPALHLQLTTPLPGAEEAPAPSLQIRTTQRTAFSFPKQGLELSLPPSILRCSGKPLQKSWKRFAVEAGFAAQDSLSLGPLTLNETRLRLKGRYTRDGFQAEHAELKTGPGTLRALDRTLPLYPLRITADEISLSREINRIETIDLSLDRIGRFQGSLQQGKELRVNLNGTGLQLSGLLDLVQPLADWDPGLWSPQGSWSLSAELNRGTTGSQARIDLDLEKLGFSSPDGSLLAQNVSPSIDLDLKRQSGLHLNATMRLNSGEALWGTRYFNLSKEPFTLQFSNTSTGNASGGNVQLQARWSDYCRLHIRGEPVLPEYSPPWTGRVELLDLSLSRLAGLIGDPEDCQVKGQASFRGRISGSPKGGSLEGSLKTGKIQAASEAGGWSLNNAALFLPVQLSFGSPPGEVLSGKEAVRWGRLHPGDIRLQGEKVEASPVSLALRPEGLIIRDPVSVSLPGLKAQLSGVNVAKPLSSDFELQGRLNVERIDLARLSGEAVPLQGEVHGTLPLLRLNRRRLTSNGTLQGSLFGGELSITDIAALRPLEPSREYGATVRVRKMPLEPVSRALNVGRITGLLNLEVENLRLAYGQPVHFSVRAESVPSDKVSQRISLKAVNTLSILGTGSGLSGIGIQFYTNFFREFPYKHIGMACTLNNDVFSLRGLIQEDGLEYLVKRSLFGINVVNTRPRNRIAFSDMLQRLERIGSQPGSDTGKTPESGISGN